MNKGFMLFFVFVLAAMAVCTTERSWRWEINSRSPKQAPQDKALEYDRLIENIRTTQYSFLVYIEKSTVRGAYLGPPSKHGYVNHLYHARVIETLKGPQIRAITFAVMADADLKPFMPDYPLLVSLCRSKDLGYHVPDNGYVSAAPDALVARIKKALRDQKGKTGGDDVCRGLEL